MLIRILSQEEIDIIAAGEVVINPANVVKELVENSIDAQASEIKIFIKNGGKDYIEVRDNGTGMSIEDIRICILPHATSKYIANTLGFRGEALYAINTSSQLEIWSSMDNIGYNQLGEKKPMTTGTQVKVNNLFYNTPARKKFLRPGFTEAKYIFTLIQNFSIIYPKIGFSLCNNTTTYIFSGEEEFFKITNGTKQLLQSEENNVKINGFISLHNSCPKYLLSVNRRMIKNSKIHSVIQNIYKKLTTKDNLSYYINIECEENFLDVNIHPTKEQVRFENEQLVLNVIADAINKALFQPKASNITVDNSLDHIPFNQSYDKLRNFNTISDIMHNQIPHKIDNVIESCCSENENIHDKFIPTHRSLDLNIRNTQKVTQNAPYHEEIFHSYKETNIYHYLEPLGQLFNKYILCTNREALVLIDQHAAAERIFTENLKTQKIHKTILLEPIVMEDTRFDISNAGNIVDYSICGNKIIISAIPDIIPAQAIMNCSRDIKQYIIDYLHEFGCKNSLKASTSLSLAEMQELINQLSRCANHNYCNHGRPITIQFTEHELDKMFERKK